VVQSSKPIVVPRVSREPMFLRRTSERPELAREEISYVCVPILLNRKASARWARTSVSRQSATSTAR
jgi:Nif-specific regulatory protein